MANKVIRVEVDLQTKNGAPVNLSEPNFTARTTLVGYQRVNATAVISGPKGDTGESGVTDHTLLTNIGSNSHFQIDSHIANTSNPHSVTKAQVGLANVDNTSDAAKPISSAAQSALDGKLPVSGTGAGDIYIDYIGGKTDSNVDFDANVNVLGTLKKSGTDVSLTGHTHTASDVTDLSTAADARIAAATGVSVQGYSANTTTLGNTTTGTGSIVRGTSPTITTPTLTVNDNAFTIQDDGDNTKKLQLQVSAIATATTRTWTFQNADDVVVGRNTTDTLTNKRVTRRIGTVASSATPTINTNNVDQFNITALAVAITSMTTNLSGTPTDGQELVIRIKDNGTPRAITWGASFVSSGVATLLATTVASKTHLIKLWYDSVAAKWVCMAVDATGY